MTPAEMDKFELDNSHHLDRLRTDFPGYEAQVLARFAQIRERFTGGK